MSDHFSGPAVMGDPSVDITDFYAFPSPERPGNLVLIMDVFPMATAQSLLQRCRHPSVPAAAADAGRAAASRPARRNTRSTSPSMTCRKEACVQKGSHRHVGRARGELRRRHAVGAGRHARLRGTGERPVLHGRRGGAPHGHVGQAVLRHGGEHRPVSRRPGDRRRGSVCADRRAIRWRDADRRDRGDPRHAPRQADPARTPRAAGDQERHHGQPDCAIRARRASSFATSTTAKTPSRSRRSIGRSTSRVSMRTWPSSTAWTATTAWPLGPDGRHPLARSAHRRLPDPGSRARLRAGGFLEIERALLDNRPHATAGGRWLDDDILDDLLTLMVNGGRGERFGDGVDAPTKPASLTFPYVREPNKRTDLPLPAFLRS